MMTSQIKNYPAILAIALSLPANTLLAQPHRIVKGNLHPLAQSQNDRGPVDPAMKLNYMSVILRRSASQEATLDQLLEQQQDSASPQYHRWLTPEQYAERFGSSQENIDKLSNWLRSSGFSNVQPARGRDFVVFSGTAAQVETGLHTPIHRY
jgi:subtilase family serine protease